MSPIGRRGLRAAPPAPGLVLSPFSRRRFVRGAAFAGAGLAVPGLLAGCGTPALTQEDCESTDRSAEEKELFFSNWPEYIDVDGDRMPTLQAFEKSSGIDVTYNADVNDNNEFFAKVQNQLGACEPINRDIIVLTDWMAARLVGLSWVQELDAANLPDVEANLVENLRSPDWDPERTFSVPWQSGLTGIAYNKKYVDKPIGSFEEMLTRPDLKGRVTLLREMRDTMAFMLRLVGADPGDFDDDEWGRAIERLEKATDSQLRGFTGNDYVDPLNSGDILACEAWSGDIIAMQYDNPDIEFVIPEEGLALWSDNMLVPNRAEHKANAEALMNHYYDPQVAAELAAWVNYICPVEGAREAMEAIDPELAEAPLIFPDDEFMSKTFAFMSLDERTAKQYDTDFARAIS
jgi:spermidine/putrescine transport system substrate-binding protein